MAKKKKKKLRTGRLVLFIVLILLIIALVGAVLFLALRKGSGGGSSEEPTTSASRELTYEGGVVTSGNGLQDAVDEMYSKAAEGYASLEYQNDIISTDGEHFTCYIANSLQNRYDMFVTIYADEDLKNEVYLSGLIPIGSAMNQFTSEKKLEKGEYSGTLVMTQVESDNATMHAQVSYTVTIKVQ